MQNAKSTSVLLFASLVLSISSLFASTAFADRVVLYSVEGSSTDDDRSHVEALISQTLRELGHQSVLPGGTNRPNDSATMVAEGRRNSSEWVLVSYLEGSQRVYRLRLVVGSVSRTRVEDIEIVIDRQDESRRVRDALAALLRPAGLGEDAIRLTDESTATERREEEAARAAASQSAQTAAAEQERLRQERERAEREAQQAREREERAARERESQAAENALMEEQNARQRAERERAEQASFAERMRYGAPNPGSLSLGIEGGLVQGLSAGPDGKTRGGGMGWVQLRGGYAVVPELELRGGVDILLGTTGGFGLMVGSTLQFTPFSVPLSFGVSAELGLAVLTSGSKDAGFAFRVSAVASYRLSSNLFIEFALPEIGVMTNGQGSMMFGATARVGYRF